MRKYYQATLALIAALSFLALLFYRHEYNKLRFVLQVFNYFGTPIQNGGFNCTNDIGVFTSNEPEFATSLPSWQRLTDDLYLYSAYDNNQGEIQAIAFGKYANNLDYSCNILFNDDTVAVVGKFSYALMNDSNFDSININNVRYCGYLLTCRYFSPTDKIIVGVQFYDVLDKQTNTIMQVNSLNRKGIRTSNVICVAPPITKPMKHRDMISFLAFHDYIEWDNFIIYDFGISPLFNNGLKRMSKFSNNQWNFTYTIVPWNFPYAQVSQRAIYRIIEADCLYRTYNKANLVVTLTWDEYINLRYDKSVENIISNFEKETDKIFNKFRLNTQIFCINEAESNLLTSTPLVLGTTRRLRNIVKNEPTYIYKINDILNKQAVEQNINDLLYINRYQVCNIEDRRETNDNGVLKFVEFMPGVQIFQQYITGRLFNY